MHATHQERQPRHSTLVVVAAVLALLVLVQALRPRDAEPVALGEMVSRAGAMTALTADAGNEDVLVVLDERSEMLLIYRTDTRNGVQQLSRLPLQTLFTEARARALGRP
ncbi:MAG: hypothetical protein SFY69_01360 [Planctomycetota bacterium]|nr:hypothetical protein [Planctomycetota bacterium]